jgi:hypothetical protein
MLKKNFAPGPMDAEEVRRRHRVFALAAAASLFIGGWLMVVESLTLLGFAVMAPGALTFGMSQRLAELPNRLQYAALAIAIGTFVAGHQYREAHRWDWAFPNLPKCGGDRIPAGGCYTVAVPTTTSR